MKPFDSFVLRAISGLIFLLVNIVSIYLLFRGHNLPGGGFIGGLSTGMSFILFGLAMGWTELEKALPVRPLHLANIGLSLGVVSSILPMLVGQPFLTHYHLALSLPVLGEVHAGTPLLFDVGVFLLVGGITLQLVIITARSTAGLPPFSQKENLLYASPLEHPIEEQGDAATIQAIKEEPRAT